MKKALLYSALAVILGLALTLVPLYTLAEVRTENRGLLMPNALSDQLKSLGGSSYHANTLESSNTDVELFAVSFVVALVAYMVFKRKTP